jgi:predicted O-methyltransferase YrrM
LERVQQKMSSPLKKDDDARRKEENVNKNRTCEKKLLSSSSPIGDLLAKLDVAYLSVNFEEMKIGSVKDLRESYFFLVENENFNEKNKRKEKEEILNDVANDLCFGEKKYAERMLEEMEEIERREREKKEEDAEENEEKSSERTTVLTTTTAEKDTRTMTSGRVYSKTFLEKTKSLYDMHMGAENMGPFLYQFCRFTKPENVLEIGAGYTSVYLMQAMRDNKYEISSYERMREDNACSVGNDDPNGEDTPWSNENYFNKGFNSNSSSSSNNRSSSSTGSRKVYDPQLHVVDNMAHAYTTAHLVKKCSEELNDDDEDVFLVVHEADAFHPDLSATLAPGVQFDFLWIDLGAANRIETFLKNFWFRVKPGGYVAVHSTLTNSLSREWLEKMRQLARNGGKNTDGSMSEYGVFDQMSFMEPHKLFQNSFTIFQRRDAHPIDSSEYKEPVLTKFP